MPRLTVDTPPKQLTHLAPMRFQVRDDHVVVADEGAHLWVLPADGIANLLADVLPTPLWANTSMPAHQLFAVDHDTLWTSDGLRARHPGLGLGPCRLVIDATSGLPLDAAKAAISLWMCSGHRHGLLQVLGAAPQHIDDLLFLSSFVKEKNRYENKSLQLQLQLGEPEWNEPSLQRLRTGGWGALVHWHPGADTDLLGAQAAAMGAKSLHLECHLSASPLPATLVDALPSWNVTSWAPHWHAMPTADILRSTIDALAQATAVPFHLCHQIAHPDQPATHHQAEQPGQTLALDGQGRLWPTVTCLQLPDVLREALQLGPAQGLTYDELAHHEAYRTLFLAALPEGREGLRHDWRTLFVTPDPTATLAATGQMVCSPRNDAGLLAALTSVEHALDNVRSPA